MTAQVGRVPDAAVMVIATFLEAQGLPKPLRLAQSLAAEVSREGWVVLAATGRSRATTIDGSSNSPLGA